MKITKALLKQLAKDLYSATDTCRSLEDTDNICRNVADTLNLLAETNNFRKEP